MNEKQVILKIELKNNENVESLTLKGGDFTFGRSSQATVCINNHSISRKHFEIILMNDNLWIRDNNSSSGTLVNYDRINSEEYFPLNKGDIVSVPLSNVEIAILDYDFYLHCKDTDEISNYSNDFKKTEYVFNECSSDKHAADTIDSSLSVLDEKVTALAMSKVEEILKEASEEAEEIVYIAERKYHELLEKAKIAASEETERTNRKYEAELKEKRKKNAIEMQKYSEKIKGKLEQELNVFRVKEIERINILCKKERAKKLQDLKNESDEIDKEHDLKKTNLNSMLIELEREIKNKKMELSNIDKIIENKYIESERELSIKNEIKINELDKIIEKKQYEVNNIDSEYINKKNELEIKHEIECHELKNNLKIVELEIDNEIKKIEVDLKTKQDDFAKRVVELENEYISKADELKRKLSLLDKEINEEKTRKYKLLEMSLEKRKMEIEEEISIYENKLANVQNEYGSVFNKYEEKNRVLKSTIEILKVEKDEVKQSITSLEIERDRLKSEYDNSYSDLMSKIGKMEQDVSELEKNKDEISVLRANIEIDVERRSNELDELNKSIHLAREQLSMQTSELISSQLNHDKLNADIAEINNKHQDAQNELMHINEKIAISTLNLEKMKVEYQQKIEQMEAQFRNESLALEEKLKIQRESEQKRLEELTHREIQNINKLKEESLGLVVALESSIVRLMNDSISKVFARTLGLGKFNEISSDIEKCIRSSLKVGVLETLRMELGVGDGSKKKQIPSFNKSGLTHFTTGFAAASVLISFLLFIYKHIQSETDPEKRRIIAQAREESAKALVKKFTPEKVDTLGATFVASVIYTRNYTEIIADESFRAELMKRGSIYLFKQWSIPEEKAIKSYAMIFSLVDMLKEKSEKIDPDFQKRDIDKMQAIEKETIKKLEVILGNEVRVEAALKFMSRHYRDYKERKQAVL